MSSGKPTLPFTGAYPALLQFQFSFPTSPGKRQHMCTDSSLWDNSEKKKRREKYPSKRDQYLDMSHLNSDSEGDAEETR